MIDFVDCPYPHGELSPCEREALYRWVSEIKPKNILEVGTGSGGSTSYMAEAIKDFNIDCTLFTCDPRRSPAKEFFLNYPFVKYHRVISNFLMAEMRSKFINPDFVFFDGSDDPKMALRDFIAFDRTASKGSYFSMHDWECVKASLLKPYIERSRHWHKVEILGNREDSVGLCLYKKI